MPNRRAIDERTCAASSFSPSISLLLTRLFRQGLERCLLLKREPERLHAPHWSSLLMTDGGQRTCKAVLIPMELGPIRKLVDIAGSSSHSSRQIPSGQGR